MIPKKDMIDGRYYNGFCRNTRVALWDGKIQMFRHLSYSFQYYMETINHFEDVKDKSLDGFVPLEIINHIEPEIIRNSKEQIGY